MALDWARRWCGCGRGHLPSRSMRMNCAAIVAIPAALCLLALGGCSGTQSPKLSVAGASIKERTDAAAVIDFIVEAENPNGDALPLQDVTYTVSRGGKPVFSGTRSAEAVIRRYGRQHFVLPASFLAPAGEEVAGEYEISGTLMYLAPGALSETLFDQALVKPEVSFAGKATAK